MLDATEAAGFDVFVTTDRNVRFQQNLESRKIAVVVLGKGQWRLIRHRLLNIAAAVAAATPGSFVEDVPSNNLLDGRRSLSSTETSTYTSSTPLRNDDWGVDRSCDATRTEPSSSNSASNIAAENRIR